MQYSITSSMSNYKVILRHQQPACETTDFDQRREDVEDKAAG